MDSERHIRFLYPPLFLIASVAWGLWLDESRSLKDLIPPDFAKDPSTTILAVVAGGGIVVTSLGLLINSSAFVVLRLTMWAFKGEFHEAALSEEALDKIQGVLGYRNARTRADTLFLVAAFDHDRLPKPVHSWLLRRWNAFNISCASVVAVALALVIGWSLHIHVGLEWSVTSATIGAIFSAIAVWAWRDVMGMLEFQARLLSDSAASSRPE